MARNDDTDIRVQGSYQRAFQAGETVFDEGESGDKLYVIQSGEIELSRTAQGGQRVVARLGAGDFFGELGVVLGKPCINRAVAACNTRVLELDRETLEAMCLSEPASAIQSLGIALLICTPRWCSTGVGGQNVDLRPAVPDDGIGAARPRPRRRVLRLRHVGRRRRARAELRPQPPAPLLGG